MATNEIEIEVTLDAKDAQIASLQSQVDALSGRRRQLELDAKDAQIALLQSHVDTKDAKIANLQSQVDAHRATMTSTRGESTRGAPS